MEQEYYFENTENLVRLEEEIKGWMNTPYRHMTKVKGMACDCIGFVVGALENAGANKGKAIIIPKYAPDWHMHNGESLLVKGVKAQFDVEEIKLDPDLIQDGDLCMFQWGRHPAHIGIAIRDRVFQSLSGIGVESRQIKDLEFYENLEHIFRIRA